jgi:nicotinamidase-related amidase
MPTVARFAGIKIMFYNDEHPPPHFHAKYNEHEALFDLNPLHLSKGYLPKVQHNKVLEWAEDKNGFLNETWDKFQDYHNAG